MIENLQVVGLIHKGSLSVVKWPDKMVMCGQQTVFGKVKLIVVLHIEDVHNFFKLSEVRVVSISCVGNDKCISPKSKAYDIVFSKLMANNQLLIVLCELGYRYILFYFLIHLFIFKIYFGLYCVFVAACGLSVVAVSSLVVHGLLIAVASLVAEHGL